LPVNLGVRLFGAHQLLDKYPEQKRDRILMTILGVASLIFGFGMWLIEDPWLCWLGVVAGVVQISLATLLSKSAFEWLKKHSYLFT
jgi:hypothetical protein